jgi:predicted HTH domain antitoxin
MQIKLDDDIAQKIGIDEREALELLAIAIYKMKGVHGALAGKIVGISEFEFHELLSKKGEVVNYGVNDLIDDINDNDL